MYVSKVYTRSQILCFRCPSWAFLVTSQTPHIRMMYPQVVGGRETEEGEPVWAPGIAEQLELDQAEGIFDLAPVEDDDEEEE